MRRIDGERRQQGKDLAQEVVFQPGLFLLRHLRAVDQHDAACSASSWRKLAPALLLVARETATASPMRASCSAGVRPSGLLMVMPARNWPLRPATRTMKNSSRLLAEIERNRTRSSSGWASLLGLLEHAAIEMQPRQLTIDEALGT